MEKLVTRKGYKQTELGEIPDDWEVSRVGLEFDVQLGKMLDVNKNSGAAKYYLGNKAVQWNKLLIEHLSTMAMSPTDLVRYRLKHGDLLVCEGGEVGRAAIWADELPECYYQKALHRLRPLRGYNTSLMLALLRYWSDHDLLADYVTRTSIAHLTREKFVEVLLPVPPNEEQTAIANALSDTDALISFLEKLINKKRAIKTAAMQQLLTGKTRLPGFDKHPNGKPKGTKQTELGEIPEDWTVGVLKEILQIPVTDGPHLTPIFQADGIPFLSVNNLVENRIDFSDARYISPKDDEIFSRKCKPKRNDLLLGKAASVGKIAIVETDLDFNIWSPIALIRVADRNVPKFLYYAFQSEVILKQVLLLTNSSSQGNIGMGDIERLCFPLPRKEEQEAIAAIFEDMDDEVNALDRRLRKTRQIKKGMMQELLTGRTRLV
jgi:type I restriction enzyme, S subunit